MTLTPAAALAAVGLVISTLTDIRAWKVPNAVTFPMIIAGLLLHIATGDPWFGFLGLLAATAIHFPLWALAVERAGDAKLLMGVGALLGWTTLIETTIWYAVLYLPIGLAVIAAAGRFANLKAVARFQMMKAQGLDPGEAPEPTMMRTAPIIAVATVLAWATDWLDLV